MSAHNTREDERLMSKIVSPPQSAGSPFRHFVARGDGRAFIVAQLGQSLDGRIATITGDSRTIGSTPSLHHLHAIRAHVDAVMVGVGTVVADDPQLNVRLCPGSHPARVVIDANGRVPVDAKCLNGADGARRIVFRKAGVNAAPLPAGVEIIPLPEAQNGGFAPDALSRALVQLGLRKVLLEGGAQTISRFIDAGMVDRLHLMVSPVIIGSGQSGLDLAPITHMHEARRPQVEVTMLGEGEVLFDCRL
jgi:diaminohydroxyphosphoribosylaminopyrimidine deaminase / 5-amino-6-(5-phosphoribosylamino)uracil reductase